MSALFTVIQLSFVHFQVHIMVLFEHGHDISHYRELQWQ